MDTHGQYMHRSSTRSESDRDRVWHTCYNQRVQGLKKFNSIWNLLLKNCCHRNVLCARVCIDEFSCVCVFIHLNTHNKCIYNKIVHDTGDYSAVFVFSLSLIPFVSIYWYGIIKQFHVEKRFWMIIIQFMKYYYMYRMYFCMFYTHTRTYISKLIWSHLIYNISFGVDDMLKPIASSPSYFLSVFLSEYELVLGIWWNRMKSDASL